MQRYLLDDLTAHYRDHRQMVLLSGPRQVGKTTLGKMLTERFAPGHYFSWDNPTHRELILKGAEEIAAHAGLNRLRDNPPLCIFDELHKYRRWKDFLKGFFDRYESDTKTLVTGSASLTSFKRSGDSLMGRYFPYTLHPVSVAEYAGPGASNSERKTTGLERLAAECAGPDASDSIIHKPSRIDDEKWDALWRFGGFPEPFLKAEQRFYNRWRKLRTEQLFREELRDLTRIHELGQMEVLAELLRRHAGQLTGYSSLARAVRVSVDTVRRWIAVLEAFYYCFAVRPWHHNVARALRKEPKYYLWDWSQVDSPGARAENLVAGALLKAVHRWSETGRGDFDLRFIRDKQKREVDFLVCRDHRPWFLVEVKSSGAAKPSESLRYFQQQTQAPHAFQVAVDAEFVERDCFEQSRPIVVPGKTFLSQLV